MPLPKKERDLVILLKFIAHLIFLNKTQIKCFTIKIIWVINIKSFTSRQTNIKLAELLIVYLHESSLIQCRTQTENERYRCGNDG